MHLFGSQSVDFSLQWAKDCRFIYPAAAFDSEDNGILPRTIPVFGQLVLKLSKPKTFDRIVVTSTIRYVAWLPNQDPYEGDRNPQDCVVLETRRNFDVGTHGLDIVFGYSASTQALSHFVQDNYGFVQYVNMHVTAIASTGKVYEADIPRKFKPGDKRIAWDTTRAARFRLWPILGSPTELSPPLNLVLNDVLPEPLGIVSLHAWANHFVHGGLVHYKISLIEPACALDIRCVRLYCIESVNWSSPKPGQPGHIFKDNKLKCSEEDMQIKVSSGSTRELTFVARLPNDAVSMCSTLPGTIGPAIISHALLWELEAYVSGQRRHIRIEKEVLMDHCCHLSEDVLVPTYSEVPSENPAYGDFQPERKRDPFACFCGFSFDQLLARDNQISRSNSTDDDALPAPDLKAT